MWEDTPQPGWPGPGGCGDARFSLEREWGEGPESPPGACAAPACTQLRSSPAPLAPPGGSHDLRGTTTCQPPNADGAFSAGFSPPAAGIEQECGRIAKPFEGAISTGSLERVPSSPAGRLALTLVLKISSWELRGPALAGRVPPAPRRPPSPLQQAPGSF